MNGCSMPTVFENGKCARMQALVAQFQGTGDWGRASLGHLVGLRQHSAIDLPKLLLTGASIAILLQRGPATNPPFGEWRKLSQSSIWDSMARCSAWVNAKDGQLVKLPGHHPICAAVGKAVLPLESLCTPHSRMESLNMLLQLACCCPCLW